MPTRRTVLGWGALAGVAGLAGCTSSPPSPAPESTSSSPAPEPSDPDADLLAVAASDEAALISAYDVALAAGADPLLTAIRDQHREHLAALGGTSPTTPPVASAPDRAELTARERTAAEARAAAALAATAPDSVRVLTLIGASEASHAAALGEAGS